MLELNSVWCSVFPTRCHLVGAIVVFWPKLRKTAWKLQKRCFGGQNNGGHANLQGNKSNFWVVPGGGGYSPSPTSARENPGIWCQFSPVTLYACAMKLYAKVAWVETLEGIFLMKIALNFGLTTIRK